MDSRKPQHRYRSSHHHTQGRRNSDADLEKSLGEKINGKKPNKADLADLLDILKRHGSHLNTLEKSLLAN